MNMETRVIGVLSSNQQLSTNIKHACEAFHEDFEVDLFEDDDSFAQYLNYELPDLVVLDVSDPVLGIRQLLIELKDDPWLHFGGVIFVYDQERVGVVPSAIRDVNLISILEYKRIDFYMPRLLRILSHNRNILYQRDLHALLSQNLSGSFVLDNDPFDLTTYSNLLANFLFNANLVSHEQKERFYVAIMELLLNAIEHGNCRITYEEKSAFLAEGGDSMDLIRERNQDPEISKKRVHLFYRIRPNVSTFRVRDEGEGFDWRKYSTATGREGLEETHGRGIFMANHYLTNLTYNDKGNEVYFELEHPPSETNAVPEMFSDRREVVLKDKEVVFTEGEKSSHLYYIVSGNFEVLFENQRISVLTPEDIFVGEMSFLLNNRRSATVRSIGQSVLLRISKREFITAIKQKPHYALFLARLLSQRLVRLRNGRVAP